MIFRLAFDSTVVLLVSNITDYDVCFCRLMSHLADVNIQSGVGMFIFYTVLRCFG